MLRRGWPARQSAGAGRAMRHDHRDDRDRKNAKEPAQGEARHVGHAGIDYCIFGRMLAAASRHTVSQLRHAAAHTAQCRWCPACRSHSSAQTLQASAHSSMADRRTFSFEPVCRVASCPVARQISAQSRFRRTHCRSIATSGSPVQASAHDMQVWAQSKHSSMHRISASPGLPWMSGWVLMMAWACMRNPCGCRPHPSSRNMLPGSPRRRPAVGSNGLEAQRVSRGRATSDFDLAGQRQGTIGKCGVSTKWPSAVVLGNRWYWKLPGKVALGDLDVRLLPVN